EIVFRGLQALRGSVIELWDSVARHGPSPFPGMAARWVEGRCRRLEPTSFRVDSKRRLHHRVAEAEAPVDAGDHRDLPREAAAPDEAEPSVERDVEPVPRRER